MEHTNGIYHLAWNTFFSFLILDPAYISQEGNRIMRFKILFLNHKLKNHYSTYSENCFHMGLKLLQPSLPPLIFVLKLNTGNIQTKTFFYFIKFCELTYKSKTYHL